MEENEYSQSTPENDEIKTIDDSENSILDESVEMNQKELPQTVSIDMGSEEKEHPDEVIRNETVEAQNLNILMKTMDSNFISVFFNGEISIYNINEIKDCLSKGFKNHDGIEMNLSNVNKMDTAGFQLVIAARMEAEKINKPLKLLEPAEDVRRIFNLYNEKY